MYFWSLDPEPLFHATGWKISLQSKKLQKISFKIITTDNKITFLILWWLISLSKLIRSSILLAKQSMDRFTWMLVGFWIMLQAFLWSSQATNVLNGFRQQNFIGLILILIDHLMLLLLMTQLLLFLQGNFVKQM